jgi:hypothetical protein
VNTEEMKQQSLSIVRQFMANNVSQSEGMVILAMTLAGTFKQNKVSQHEAISRFTTIVKHVYQGESK